MTDTEAGIVAAVFALAVIVAAVGAILLDYHLGKARDADEAEAERHRADVVAWRAIPGDHTRELREVPVVSRSPLLEGGWRDGLADLVSRAVAAGDTVAEQVRAAQQRRQGVGRHRAELRDDTEIFDVLPELATTTQVEFMNALKAAGETPPTSFGPAELMHRRVSWQDQPPTWEQAALDVGIPS